MVPSRRRTAAEPEAKADGQETILVVEDDERVRNLTVNRLKGLGYRVHEAADGATAIRMLEDGLAVDLVFSDLVMPGGLTGHDVARRARELDPAIESAADLGLCRGSRPQ